MRAAVHPLTGDGGSGTVLAVGVAGAVVAALVLALTLDGALVARQTAASAADAGALAGADVAGGGAPGIPCAAASQVAAADGADGVSCTQRGTVVSVRTSVRLGPLSASAAAAAGPPAAP